MKLVIDIPDEAYDILLSEQKLPHDLDLEYLIMHSTPLPKGHGRLKDVDAIMRELSVVSSRPVKSQMYMIEQAPTIIEADNESEDEE